MTKHPFDPDELAEYLDHSVPPRTSRTTKADEDPLVDAALQLANEDHPTPSIETAMHIQVRLLAEAKALQNVHGRHRLRIPRRTLGLVASVILMMSFIILPSVAAASVPGDLLYPVKRTFEHVELAAASVLGGEASTYLRHAERRAQEALVLFERDDFSTDLLAQAVDNMVQAAQIAERDSDTESALLVGRTVQVHAMLDFMIDEAGRRNLSTETTLMNLSGTLQAAQNERQLLLPDSPPTQIPAMTEPPSSQEIPSRTATPITPTTTPEQRPEITVSPASAFIASNTAVNVRSGPGTDFNITTQLQPGTSVQVIGANEDVTWLMVNLPDGTEGWIAASLLYVGNTAPQVRGTPTGLDTQATQDNRPTMATPVPAASANPPPDTGPPGNPGAPPRNQP